MESGLKTLGHQLAIRFGKSRKRHAATVLEPQLHPAGPAALEFLDLAVVDHPEIVLRSPFRVRPNHQQAGVRQNKSGLIEQVGPQSPHEERFRERIPDSFGDVQHLFARLEHFFQPGFQGANECRLVLDRPIDKPPRENRKQVLQVVGNLRIQFQFQLRQLRQNLLFGRWGVLVSHAKHPLNRWIEVQRERHPEFLRRGITSCRAGIPGGTWRRGRWAICRERGS